jgi:hypothetical protein
VQERGRKGRDPAQGRPASPGRSRLLLFGSNSQCRWHEPRGSGNRSGQLGQYSHQCFIPDDLSAYLCGRGCDRSTEPRLDLNGTRALGRA